MYCWAHGRSEAYCHHYHHCSRGDNSGDEAVLMTGVDRFAVTSLIFSILRFNAFGAVGVCNLARWASSAGCCAFIMGDVVSRTQDTEGALVVIRESASSTWHALRGLPILSFALSTRWQILTIDQECRSKIQKAGRNGVCQFLTSTIFRAMYIITSSHTNRSCECCGHSTVRSRGCFPSVQGQADH